MDDTAVANLALAMLTEGAITSLSQDKHAARTLNKLYIPTRRAELRKHTWVFAISSSEVEGTDLGTGLGTWRWRYPIPYGGTDLTDIIANGTFASGASWTAGTGWTIAVGVATHAGPTTGDLKQTLTVEEKLGYRLVYTVSGYSAGIITPSFQSSIVLAEGEERSEDGTFTEYLRAPNGTTAFALRGNAAFVGSVDNVSLTGLTKTLRVLPLTYNGEPNGVQLNWRPQGNYILSDQSSPRIIRAIVDVPDPDDWDPLFVDVMAGALAVKSAWSITGKLDAIKVAQGAYDKAMRDAVMGNALERGGRLDSQSFALARGDTRGWWRA